MSKLHPPKYQTINWQAYNHSLKQRAQLLLWLDKYMNWQAPLLANAGVSQLSPMLSSSSVSPSNAYLVWHYAEPQAWSKACCAWLDLAGPSPTAAPFPAARRTCKCAFRYKKKQGCLHLLVGSTGIKMMGEGEWKVKKHGADYHRQWPKLHWEVDAQTLEIWAMEVTDNRTGDATMLQERLSQIPENLFTICDERPSAGCRAAQKPEFTQSK